MNSRHIKAALVLLLVVSGTGLEASAIQIFPQIASLLDANPLTAAASGLSTVAAAPPASNYAGAGFTYQGKLLDNGQPVSGQYDFTFRLFDAATGAPRSAAPTLCSRSR